MERAEGGADACDGGWIPENDTVGGDETGGIGTVGDDETIGTVGGGGGGADETGGTETGGVGGGSRPPGGNCPLSRMDWARSAAENILEGKPIKNGGKETGVQGEHLALARSAGGPPTD